MKLRRCALIAVAAACSKGAPANPAMPAQPTGPATPAPSAARQLTTETAITTAWSATLTVPASFWITEAKDLVRIQDPEREAALAFVALPAADGKTAITEAWKRIDPSFALAVADAADLPGRDGWDAGTQISYVTKTDDARIVIALARKKAALWYVTTIDGKQAAIGRRGAQIQALVVDMKVPGLDAETFAGKQPQLDAAHLAKLDAFVEEARGLAGVPGVAIGIVHGGKLVFERGHGVRALSTKQPVTPSTLFMIGSTTKSLTTVMLARLVDQKRLDWATPVAEVLPTFALGDAATTAKLTVQHTVCACTGMPRNDLEFLFEYDGWDPERRLASMAAMKPTTGFGETFQYSNLMVATGGWVGAHVYAPTQKLGPAYDAAMGALVFAPLGMTSTTFDSRQAMRGDHARSHGHGMSTVYQETPIDYERAVYAVRPAGAAWSSVRDMAKYVALELARGKTPDGKQLVGEASFLRRREPQVKIDADNAYGLGLFVSVEHGVKVLHHGGNMLGYTSDLFFLPDHDLGVIVLTNAGGANAFRAAVRRAFYEAVFDGKPEARENLTTSLARTQKAIDDERALMKPADDAWIAPLLGTYIEPLLGKLVLRREGKVLVMDAGEWKTEFTKKLDRDGVAKLITTLPPYAGFELVPKVADGKQHLLLDAGQQVYAFVRQ